MMAWLFGANSDQHGVDIKRVWLKADNYLIAHCDDARVDPRKHGLALKRRVSGVLYEQLENAGVEYNCGAGLLVRVADSLYVRAPSTSVQPYVCDECT